MSTPSKSFLFKHYSRNERTHETTHKKKKTLSLSLFLPVVVRSSLLDAQKGRREYSSKAERRRIMSPFSRRSLSIALLWDTSTPFVYEFRVSNFFCVFFLGTVVFGGDFE
jgi:hypothetical protein